MYCDFYQLTERPFNVTPDPKFLYLNARYREAIASLNYGITQRKGFITLIGEAGTGKTTLLKKLLEDLDPKTKTVFIFNTNVTFEEILEYIFAEFDLPVHNGKKLYMLQRLNTFLLEELRGGGNVALLIDEAQDLELSVLEDLRLLSNLETAKEKILQIVMSGQPELGQKLSNPVLRQLRQRIGINCRLLPLSRDEITEYIRFRLEAANCPDLKLFSREAEDQIYHFSRGIPRLVNVVCDNAMVIGYALGKKRIGADVIAEAAADLISVESQFGDVKEQPVAVAAPQAPEPPANRWRARLGVSGVVLVAALVGLLSVGRTMLYKHTDEPAVVAPHAARLEVIRPGSEPRGTGVEYPTGPPGGIAEANEDAGAGAPPPAVAAQVVSVKELAATGTAPRPSDGSKTDAAVAKLRETEGVPLANAPESEAQRIVQPRRAPEVRDVAPSVQERPAGVNVAERSVPATAHEPAASNKAAEKLAAVGVLKSDEAVHKSDDTAAKVSVLSSIDRRNEAKARGAAAAEPEAATDSIPPSATGNAPRLDGVTFARVVVRDGDSVSGIAQRKYGQASYTILDLLKLANPELRDIDVISVGQTIRLPELGEGFPILNEGSGHYALLVFSTIQQRRATALQSALRSHGFEAGVTSGSAGLRQPLYRVVLSGFADRDEVVGIGKQVQRLFREDTRLAQLGE